MQGPIRPPRFDRVAPEIETVHRWLTACLAPRRLEILLALDHLGESSVSDLADHLDLERSAVSHAMVSLRDVGLVAVRAAGRRRLHRVGTGFAFIPQPGGFALTLRHPRGWSVRLERHPVDLSGDGQPDGETAPNRAPHDGVMPSSANLDAGG